LTPDRDRLVARIDAVQDRLQRLAGTALQGLTAPDPPTGEQWDAGQVWAHLAEFVPYWIDQLSAVADTWRPGGLPPPFGRTKADPGRVAAIQRDRREDPVRLLGRLEAQLGQLRPFLQQVNFDTVGRHPTLGAMPMPVAIEEFLVGHLEQHADQLAGLTVDPAR
jgi:hypothetical protein